MPSRYIIRDFSNGSFYHVFNRGVEKRKIFMDGQDYKLFLYYMFIYLLPLNKVLESYPLLPLRLQSRNLSQDVEIVSYSLMPNHFHLLLKQKKTNGISKLLKQLTNAYTLYFNQKYQRVGGLVQGRFKAVGIPNEELLLHITRYIHLNPVVAGIVKDPKDYEWSSHKDYLGNNSSFLKKDLILSFLSSPKKFEEFVLQQIDYAKETEKIKHLTLED